MLLSLIKTQPLQLANFSLSDQNSSRNSITRINWLSKCSSNLKSTSRRSLLSQLRLRAATRQSRILTTDWSMRAPLVTWIRSSRVCSLFEPFGMLCIWCRRTSTISNLYHSICKGSSTISREGGSQCAPSNYSTLLVGVTGKWTSSTMSMSFSWYWVIDSRSKCKEQ